MDRIVKSRFGKTGHASTRIIFGGAAFYAMNQARADKVLELLLEYGINHIDVAPIYGDAEARIGAWMPEYRNHFFIATKTEERSAKEAGESIRRSLERMRIDCIDLVQLHNLTDEDGWKTAMAAGGALEAAVEARDKGLVRHIGVTGHGMKAPQMHLRSLERFDFDSVLLPLTYTMMQDESYSEDVTALLEVCRSRNIAVQTIKSISRRRWPKESTDPHFSWYQPLKDPDAIRRAVHWVLSHPDVFLNTSSDATLLPLILQAAADFDPSRPEVQPEHLEADVETFQMAPIFAEGLDDPF